MSETSPAPRGNPPNRDQLAERLKEAQPLWNEVRETVIEMGASWKWAHSEATGAWSYRSYLAGDRFFASMTPQEAGFEVSLNLKGEEWAAVSAATPEEQALLEQWRERATAGGEDPAWVHVPVSDRTTLPLLARMLVARARRPQKPRLKPAKKR